MTKEINHGALIGRNNSNLRYTFGFDRIKLIPATTSSKPRKGDWGNLAGPRSSGMKAWEVP